MFPNAERMNRGNTVLRELVDACKAQDVTDMIIVHEHRGQPDGLVVCHLPYGPTCSFGVVNPVLRHDLKVPTKRWRSGLTEWSLTGRRTGHCLRGLSAPDFP